MLWDMGNVQCEICEIVQLSQNKIKCNSIMASPGLIYIHIYPPGDKGLMYILVKLVALSRCVVIAEMERNVPTLFQK